MSLPSLQPLLPLSVLSNPYGRPDTMCALGKMLFLVLDVQECGPVATVTMPIPIKVYAVHCTLYTHTTLRQWPSWTINFDVCRKILHSADSRRSHFLYCPTSWANWKLFSMCQCACSCFQLDPDITGDLDSASNMINGMTCGKETIILCHSCWTCEGASPFATRQTFGFSSSHVHLVSDKQLPFAFCVLLSN